MQRNDEAAWIRLVHDHADRAYAAQGVADDLEAFLLTPDGQGARAGSAGPVLAWCEQLVDGRANLRRMFNADAPRVVNILAQFWAYGGRLRGLVELTNERADELAAALEVGAEFLRCDKHTCDDVWTNPPETDCPACFPRLDDPASLVLRDTSPAEAEPEPPAERVVRDVVWPNRPKYRPSVHPPGTQGPDLAQQLNKIIKLANRLGVSDNQVDRRIARAGAHFKGTRKPMLGSVQFAPASPHSDHYGRWVIREGSRQEAFVDLWGQSAASGLTQDPSTSTDGMGKVPAGELWTLVAAGIVVRAVDGQVPPDVVLAMVESATWTLRAGMQTTRMGPLSMWLNPLMFHQGPQLRSFGPVNVDQHDCFGVEVDVHRNIHLPEFASLRVAVAFDRYVQYRGY